MVWLYGVGVWCFMVLGYGVELYDMVWGFCRVCGVGVVWECGGGLSIASFI